MPNKNVVAEEVEGPLSSLSGGEGNRVCIELRHLRTSCHEGINRGIRGKNIIYQVHDVRKDFFFFGKENQACCSEGTF